MRRVERALVALGIEAARDGDELVARCPYHDDQKPSWSINWRGDKTGLQHCFSCQSGGTLLDLVVYVRKCSYTAGRQWLEDLDAGDQAGPAAAPSVSVRPSSSTRRPFKLPSEVCCDPLEQWPTPPRRYAQERGITPGQVSGWGLAYAVVGRLGGRLVVPVRDRSGRPAAYMARDYAGEGPRYLYPKAEERPDLDVLFGEQRWPASGRERVVVTEGALDALAAERAGAPQVAAIGGSHVRPVHVAKLATFREVVLLTDSDAAGDRAARELGASLGRHSVVRRVRLPEGKDANTMRADELRGALRVPGA